MRATGTTDRSKNVGFTLTWGGSRKLRINWVSGQVNSRNFPEAARTRIAPESVRRAGRAGRSAAPVTDRSLLDVDLCVLIACTVGDGIVCLDYREQPERPAVVVSEWGARPDGGVAWREIATDIEQLAARVGL